MGALVRAERKAVQAREEQAEARSRQYLTFVVGGETFAIAIASIREIIEYRNPTDVPMMPAFMRGVINLRGHVVPVIDLAVRFGRDRGEVSKRTCIVILEVAFEGQQQEISVVVDSVSAVVDIADADIEPPPQFGAMLRADFISGMGRIGEKFVIILDVDQVLSVEELSALGEMDAGEAPALAAPEDPPG